MRQFKNYILLLFLFINAFLSAETSLHVLIASIGRSSLMQMLDSLKPQVKPCDFITLVFDARNYDGVFNESVDYLRTFDCATTVIMEETNLGFWGHGIRNKHNRLSGDFILHADDDDIYAPDALEIVRTHCVDKNTVYIFKMQYVDGNSVWKEEAINHGEIGTPMGAVPAGLNSRSDWYLGHGGDFCFYRHFEYIRAPIKFVDKVIYLVRPNV